MPPWHDACFAGNGFHLGHGPLLHYSLRAHVQSGFVGRRQHVRRRIGSVQSAHSTSPEAAVNLVVIEQKCMALVLDIGSCGLKASDSGATNTRQRYRQTQRNAVAID